MPNPHLIEPSSDGLRWYALKVVDLKSLLPAGIESYVPVHTVETHEHGRLSYTEEPLIPSLMFVRCNAEWLVAFKRDHNEDFMYYTAKDPDGNNVPGPIRDEEMRSFILVTSAEAGRGATYFGADAPEYHTGDRVRVTGGIYAGAEGYIKRIKKDRKLIVAVSGVAVVAVSYIHPDFLEKL